MNLRWFAVPLVALLGAGVAVIPSVSSSAVGSTATVSGLEPMTWSPQQVTIPQDGQVTFEDASKTDPHGVLWLSGPETPVCSAGVPIDKGATNWRGTCSFGKPGTYDYYCYVHGMAMSGSVVVESPEEEVTTSGTPSTGTTASTPTGTQGTTTMAMPMGSGAGNDSAGEPPPSSTRPADSLAAGALRLRVHQRRRVRASLEVGVAGSSLAVVLLARNAQLRGAGADGSREVTVGRLARADLAAGNLLVEVPLDARARAALARHGHLALLVRLSLTAPGAASLRRSLAVTLSR